MSKSYPTHLKMIPTFYQNHLRSQLSHRISDRLNRLVLIWVDAGYQGKGFMRWVMDTYHWVLQVARLPVNTKGFVVLPKRWFSSVVLVGLIGVVD
jgi:hypothetical protein